LHHDPSDGRFTTVCSSDRVAAAYGQYFTFFYIENFLHEVDFETILPIMLVECNCGVETICFTDYTQYQQENIINFLTNV